MKKKAFTLIELLVVVAIVAIILSAILGGIQHVKQQTNNPPEFQIGEPVYLTQLGIKATVNMIEGDNLEVLYTLTNGEIKSIVVNKVQLGTINHR